MNTVEKGIMFALDFVLGKDVNYLKEEYSELMDLTENGASFNVYGDFGLLRNQVMVVNELYRNFKEYTECDNPLEQIEKYANNVGVTNYTLYGEEMLEELPKEMKISYLTYLNFLTGYTKTLGANVFKTIFSTNEVTTHRLLRLFLSSNFREPTNIKQFQDSFLENIQDNGTVMSKSWLLSIFENDDKFLRALNLHFKLEEDQQLQPIFDYWNNSKILKGREFDFNQKSIYYIDCDNVQFKQFMKLMNHLDTSKNSLVKLFKDTASRDTWGQVENSVYAREVNGETFTTTVEVYEVFRLNGAKSVVDQVIIGHFMKDAEIKDKYIVSSDSDYFSLHIIGEDFGVFYDKDCISANYLEYLKSKNVKHVDLVKMKQPFVFKPILDTMCKQGVLKYLSTQYLVNWVEGVVMTYLTIILPDETLNDIELTDEYAQEITTYVLNNIKIEREGTKTKLSLDDIEITI